ncbi:uncharacterized protein LOC110824030 [Carica papaya]|uniref:uncharacterized protein LOC110824030 n=1 Tax=Carica papaya TaxID=3649 RepID=UPI000B8CFF24|nr:uncharacterized protein LOC110824030 [Carica papaya]
MVTVNVKDFNDGVVATIRTLLAVAAAKGWILHQLDINNAFLKETFKKKYICCLHQVQDIKTFLHKTFGIKELGELKFFLGFKVARSDKGSKPAATPLVSSVKLSKSDGSPAVDNTTYRQLLVKLLYLTHTRLDITFAVQQLLQFLEALTGCHMQAAHRVLQYLKNAPGQGLFYPGQNSLQLKGFSDSYWGTCADSRKSITGYCVFLGQSL